MRLIRNVHLDVQNPGGTLLLTLTAPILNELKLELDFVRFQDDILTLHILSNRKIADLLHRFLERFMRAVPFIGLAYPLLEIDMRLVSRQYFPQTRIRNIALVDRHYIIETEPS